MGYKFRASARKGYDAEAHVALLVHGERAGDALVPGLRFCVDHLFWVRGSGWTFSDGLSLILWALRFTSGG